MPTNKKPTKPPKQTNKQQKNNLLQSTHMLSFRLGASDHVVLLWLTVLSVTCDLRAHNLTFRKLGTKAYDTSKT